MLEEGGRRVMEHPVYCIQYFPALNIDVELKFYKISGVWFVQRVIVKQYCST